MPEASTKTERRRRSARHILSRVAICYAYDAVILFGYHTAGYVPLSVPFVYAGLCVVCVGLVALAHASGASARFKDPTLFLPQQLFAMLAMLLVLAMAPQIAFQPIATLFAVCAYGFMAPNLRGFVVCWTFGAAATMALLLVIGPEMRMPTATLAGQALTGAAVFGLLLRFVWTATFVHRLRMRHTDDNAALQSAMQRVEVLAHRDELTGLPNRRAITAWLDEQIAVCDKAGRPISVAIFDLDHFKRINDRLGHHGGDIALQAFAALARNGLRTSDRIGRFGGEEFLAVLVGASLADAAQAVERIRDAVNAHDWRALGGEARLTVTAGVAQHVPGQTAQSVLRASDMALYRGKEQGRNRVALAATSELPAAARSRASARS